MVFQPPQDNRSIYNLDNTFEMVRERLAKIDVTQQRRNSGSELEPQGTVIITYLNHLYRINVSNADVSRIDATQIVPIREKILILRYFLQAKGTPLTDKLIPFRDLPGGLVYYPTFIKRTVKPLTDTFGKDASLLKKAGEIIGSRQGDFGDASLIIDAFPRVPITIILWQGDDELPSDLNLLYNSNISDYMETEDVTVISEIITWRLINSIRNS